MSGSFDASCPLAGADQAPEDRWAVLAHASESAKVDLTALGAFVATLDERVGALAVDRIEDAARQRRTARVLRIFRPGAVHRWPRHPDEEPSLTGEIALLPAELSGLWTLSRRGLSGLLGQAEAAEHAGRWLDAERLWGWAADGDDPWAAWAQLRQARALAQLSPTSSAVTPLLLRSLGKTRRIAEAYLHLALAAHTRRDLDGAWTWLQLGEAVEPLATLPQLDGGASWSTPTRLALATVETTPRWSSRVARLALSRRPPVSVAERLMHLAGLTGPAVLDRAEDLRGELPRSVK